MNTVTEQKGVSSSTPSFVKRWYTSKLLTHVASAERLEKNRQKAEKKRIKEGRSHVVEYFHQVNDGYSHLAIQTLAPLLARYNIELIVHLVTTGHEDNIPEPEMLARLSIVEAAQIAPYYKLAFPQINTAPSKQICQLATQLLCNLSVEQIIKVGPKISTALWTNNHDFLNEMSRQHGLATPDETAAAVALGNQRREKLGHYNGAMFWYAGEWYWGVDRLYHLEKRLESLDAVKQRNQPEVAPRPEIKTHFASGAGALTLEYYPSLRSPYTAVSWDPTMKLVQDSGVKLNIKPVLPMVMRGVPATRQKGLYIFMDASREARSLGIEYGKFYDPIGTPVKNGYSLYMWAHSLGKGAKILGAFLKLAFVHGVNTNSPAGMKKLVTMAGLDWSDAKHHIGHKNWETLLENNRASMYRAGCWGVPSYRLLGQDEQEIMSVWGQDRLWLISQKISEIS